MLLHDIVSYRNNIILEAMHCIISPAESMKIFMLLYHKFHKTYFPFVLYFYELHILYKYIKYIKLIGINCMQVILSHSNLANIFLSFVSKRTMSDNRKTSTDNKNQRKIFVLSHPYHLL